MIPDVRAILAASSPLVAIVGDKIYRTAAAETAAGTPVPPPYVVWSIVAAIPENNLSELPDTDNARIQIDCYSDSQPQARAMAQATQAAIEAVTHVIFGPTETKEDDTKLWRWSMDASFWNSR